MTVQGCKIASKTYIFLKRMQKMTTNGYKATYKRQTQRHTNDYEGKTTTKKLHND